MTPLPLTTHRLKNTSLPIYDPEPGTVHIWDLISEAKDTTHPHNGHRLSEYVIGLLLLALHLGLIEDSEVCLFLLPFSWPGFNRTMLRVKYHPQSSAHQFSDPNGQPFDFRNGDPAWGVFKNHRDFQAWKTRHLFAGRTGEEVNHPRAQLNRNRALKKTYYFSPNDKGACDSRVNKAYAAEYGLDHLTGLPLIAIS